MIDQGFKATPYPLRVDLTRLRHSNASSRPETCSSARSTEFQTVLDGFTSLKLSQVKPDEYKTTNYIEENKTRERLLPKRRNSIELSPINAFTKEFRQRSLTARCASLPSLGLVAVEIQYSVPSQRKSGSYPKNISRGIEKGELNIIKEVPKKGRENAGIPSRDFQGTNALSLSNRLGVNRVLRGRRFSLDAQRNINTTKSTFGATNIKRRKSCYSRVQHNSDWRIKVHRRSLDINDDCENAGASGC